MSCMNSLCANFSCREKQGHMPVWCFFFRLEWQHFLKIPEQSTSAKTLLNEGHRFKLKKRKHSSVIVFQLELVPRKHWSRNGARQRCFDAHPKSRAFYTIPAALLTMPSNIDGANDCHCSGVKSGSWHTLELLAEHRWGVGAKLVAYSYCQWKILFFLCFLRRHGRHVVGAAGELLFQLVPCVASSEA